MKERSVDRIKNKIIKLFILKQSSDMLIIVATAVSRKTGIQSAIYTTWFLIL
jgi:hypothetical protein